MNEAPIRKGALIVEAGTEWPVFTVTQVSTARTLTRGNHLAQYEVRVPVQVKCKHDSGSHHAFRPDQVQRASAASAHRLQLDREAGVARMDRMIDAGETLTGWTAEMMLATRNLQARRAGLNERTA